ncbi:MAG: arsenic resistance protein [Brevibacterium sp.]|uniref:arsenic resistance protein n=1 Tax=Brevibacterium sp. TaxID=1701 RepID=UPI002648EB55|nr:arsenic resistance protein [Brevibacterium sp.]MDN5806122.1 arsenic resistance protein [Brevibacterium sp.]MDN5832630.1 arsenic resistance protein [Brevibacterium sp.]MDN5875508.1 arsenic resistance protein [Brevibacterium sp.]MDN5908454.1 arsenic resistance protein [Brevibacterium sp.]MDN6132592.1 arsenic resistance protein [Brevibacterium sp.]
MALIGLSLPVASTIATSAITGCLIALLFVTFLDIPFDAVRDSFTDMRFLGAVVLANFLIVLLTPCIDYVLVFTRLAGGAHARLLALTPVLMLAQIILLPVYLWIILGEVGAAAITPRPFITALLIFIVLPLTGSVTLRLLSRRSAVVDRSAQVVSESTVPLMMLTLAVIAAVQVPLIAPYLAELGGAIATFVVFAIIVTGLGWILARVLPVNVGMGRALVFTAVTRNSLVMLPIVRAITADGIGPAAVVAQTIVELVFMLILVRVVPHILPGTTVSENR